MGSRRKARISALQMLFQYDVARPRLDELIDSYWGELAEDIGQEAREFSNRVVLGTINHLDEIDNIIAKHSEHWRISRMTVVDRNILRMAVYEFLYEPQTPAAVVINEALEIARRFSTFEATQFINGILDAIKRDLESSQKVE
jgi:N utilization substance protein B